jgi:hypothetical protein
MFQQHFVCDNGVSSWPLPSMTEANALSCTSAPWHILMFNYAPGQLSVLLICLYTIYAYTKSIQFSFYTRLNSLCYFFDSGQSTRWIMFNVQHKLLLSNQDPHLRYLYHPRLEQLLSPYRNHTKALCSWICRINTTVVTLVSIHSLNCFVYY